MSALLNIPKKITDQNYDETDDINYLINFCVKNFYEENLTI